MDATVDIETGQARALGSAQGAGKEGKMLGTVFLQLAFAWVPSSRRDPYKDVWAGFGDLGVFAIKNSVHPKPSACREAKGLASQLAAAWPRDFASASLGAAAGRRCGKGRNSEVP